jgi:hypothetical protein
MVGITFDRELFDGRFFAKLGDVTTWVELLLMNGKISPCLPPTKAKKWCV